MKSMTFEQEGRHTITEPSWQDIESAILGVNPHEGRGYFILTVQDGSYVQAAGARLRMIVEYRKMAGDGSFQQFVVGKPHGNTAWTSINSSVGIIQLQFNEVLSANKAVELFKAFFETSRLPDDVVLRDDTARFKET